ncbi:SgrR family transcriptional regulator [Edwardsiella ictaluri]|uniref:SgrR family transcriptional regulator n=1 Tax=Edwardsiella ictaluri TaxID=67780 RepID=UPI0034A49093
MRLLQRLNQYQRLYQFAGDVPVSATVAELAAIICCSDRHVRTLLGQLQEAGWIRWQASAGRGRRGSLRCLLPVSQLRHQLMEHLLREGNHQGALRLAARDPAQLTPYLQPHLGGHWQAELPTLRIPYYRPLEPIPPLQLSGRAEQHLAHTLHAGLTRFVPGSTAPQPDLAHHWQISADGLCWQFLLHNNLRWHHGQPIGAGQLLETLRALCIHPQASALLASVAAIDRPHPLCLRFTLHSPDYWLAHRLANLLCLLPHPQLPDIGAGPFRLVSASPTLLRLEQYEGYHLRRPYLHAIEYWITAGAGTALPSCQRAVRIQIQQHDEGAQDTRRLKSSTSLGFGYMAVNLRQGRLSPRQARDLLGLMREGQTFSALSLEEGITLRCEELLPGWAIPAFTGPPGPLPPRLTLLSYPASALHQLARRLQSRLAACGCALTLQLISGKRWSDDAQLAQADIILGDKRIGESPGATLDNWPRTDRLWQAILPPNAYADTLARLNLQRQVSAEAQRLAALRQLYGSLMAQGYMAPLFNYRYQVSVPPRVNGIILTAHGWFDFCQAWVPAPAASCSSPG